MKLVYVRYLYTLGLTTRIVEQADDGETRDYQNCSYFGPFLDRKEIEPKGPLGRDRGTHLSFSCLCDLYFRVVKMPDSYESQINHIQSSVPPFTGPGVYPLGHNAYPFTGASIECLENYHK